MYLIDHPGFFARAGIYGDRDNDYPDNLKRFVFFSRAAAMAAVEVIRPEVMHAHDWHSAGVPIAMRADSSLRDKFKDTLSIFTIHNLAFQGIGKREDFALLGIDPSYYSIDYLEYYGTHESDEGCDRALRRRIHRESDLRARNHH